MNIEPKFIWFCLLVFSIVGMIFATNRASESMIDNFDQAVEVIPWWQRLIYGLLDVCPYHLLKPRGKKWQTVVFLLLIPALISGYHLGQLVVK